MSQLANAIVVVAALVGCGWGLSTDHQYFAGACGALIFMQASQLDK